jgi:hypothetical protein
MEGWEGERAERKTDYRSRIKLLDLAERRRIGRRRKKLLSRLNGAQAIREAGFNVVGVYLPMCNDSDSTADSL